MTRHLNKKHVLFHVERSQQFLKTASLFATKESSRAELKKHFWNVHNVVLESFCFALETKAVFIIIRYPKTSQTQDVKSQSTKLSLRELAQPERDSASEQKTRIVPSRETSGSSQIIFFSYNQRKKQSSAQTDIFGTYSTSFCKVDVFLSERSPITFRTVCTKIIKTIAHNPKRRRPRFRKNQKLFFPSFWYRKTSQTEEVKSQSTAHSVRKIPQPKRDSAFEQKTRIVSCRETSASSQNSFFIYNQRIQPSRAQKDISGTYTMSFWKVSVLLKKQKLFL